MRRPGWCRRPPISSAVTAGGSCGRRPERWACPMPGCSAGPVAIGIPEWRARRRRTIPGRCCARPAAVRTTIARSPISPPSSMRFVRRCCSPTMRTAATATPTTSPPIRSRWPPPPGGCRGCWPSSVPGRSPIAGLTGLARPADLLTAGPGDLGFLADDDLIDVAVPVHWWAPARRSALAAHATQVAVFDGGYTLSNRIAQPLADHEYYRRLAGPPVPRADDGGPADDLFAGLA